MADTGDLTKFTTVDQQADPGDFIRWLDTGRLVIRPIKQAIRVQLALREGLRALDVGCGPGDDARELAQDVGPSGEVVGVDISSAMIAEAMARHAASGLPVRFAVGDAQRLAFADASFDCGRIDRALMHLARPEQAVAEIVRVVRPGGNVVAFDFDWGTTFIDSPYDMITRRVIDAFSNNVPHGWIGRRLPRLCAAAGLTDITCTPHAARIPYSVARTLLASGADAVQAAGEASADDLARWWGYLEQAEREGHCHIGQFGFLVSGVRR